MYGLEEPAPVEESFAVKLSVALDVLSNTALPEASAAKCVASLEKCTTKFLRTHSPLSSSIMDALTRAAEHVCEKDSLVLNQVHGFQALGRLQDAHIALTRQGSVQDIVGQNCITADCAIP